MEHDQCPMTCQGVEVHPRRRGGAETLQTVPAAQALLVQAPARSLSSAAPGTSRGPDPSRSHHPAPTFSSSRPSRPGSWSITSEAAIRTSMEGARNRMVSAMHLFSALLREQARSTRLAAGSVLERVACSSASTRSRYAEFSGSSRNASVQKAVGVAFACVHVGGVTGQEVGGGGGVLGMRRKSSRPVGAAAPPCFD